MSVEILARVLFVLADTGLRLARYKKAFVCRLSNQFELQFMGMKLSTAAVAVPEAAAKQQRKQKRWAEGEKRDRRVMQLRSGKSENEI